MKRKNLYEFKIPEMIDEHSTKEHPTFGKKDPMFFFPCIITGEYSYFILSYVPIQYNERGLCVQKWFINYEI